MAPTTTRRSGFQPRPHTGPRTGIIAAVSLLLTLTAWSQPALQLTFDDSLDAGPLKPLLAEAVTLVPGKSGQAASVGPGAKLAYPAPEFLKDGFDIRLWIKHDRALGPYPNTRRSGFSFDVAQDGELVEPQPRLRPAALVRPGSSGRRDADLWFEELVYLYHETPNERNRICLQKRQGTDYILFSMSDGTGRAKGAQFSGNWFAMKSPPLNWPANTWHELRITASRAKGEAALYIDGGLAASAQGSELPQEIADRFWLGSLNGRSQMLGVIDEVTIRPAREGE